MKPLTTSILALLGTASLASATLVNVDFGTGGAAGTFSGAAALGTAGDTWTSVSRANGNAFSGISLLTSGNQASGLSVSLTAFQGAFDLSGTAPYNSNVSTALKPLMLDYLSVTNQGAGPIPSATVTLSGFTPSSSVDIILYSANTAGQGAIFTIAGFTPLTTSDPTGSMTSLTEGQQFVRFNGVTTSGTGTVDIGWAVASGKQYGALNGMQIQYVPEPSAMSALLGGTGVLLGLRRRRS